MTALVLGCFFLSGASGLVFEAVWTRELTLVFGSTALAMSTVLSVFMGGLALGSWLAGRWADRIIDRLRAYALAEAGVGIYALAVPLVLASYPALNHAMYRILGASPVGLSLARFVAAALLLLVPTTLMGATLPILSRHFVRDDGTSVAGTVGRLYAINTFGAVVGTFVGGFMLLPGVGVRATNYSAAAINLTLAAAVWVGRKRLVRPEENELDSVKLDSDAPAPPIFSATLLQRRVALIAFALSGAIAMIDQVLWTRALAIIIGSSVYSFTLILLAFLVGLAGGAAIISRLTARTERPMEWLAGVHLATAAMIGVSYLLMDKLPSAFLGLLRGGAFSVDGIIFCQFLLAALAVFPATLCMGGVLPLTIRVVARSLESVGRDVGTAYSVNTLGAILGSFAAGFIVLPVAGLQRGLGIGAVTTVGLAATLIVVARPNLRRWVAAALLPAVALGSIHFLPRWSLRHFSAGLFRVSIAKDIIESNKWQLPNLLYYHDGIATTVSVEQWSHTVALKNNGKVDASNGDDMSTQIMVGLLPFVFWQAAHPNAADKPRAAVIGFGSGVTIGAVTQFPMKHADVVELEPSVVHAGVTYFGPWNHHPEKDPRVQIRIGDGRNFLTQASDKYDVIVSEPSNPWITGVSNLFTVDYWKLARSRLADDGVFCQWAQLYEMSSKNIKVILRSFAEVFPYTYVFSAEDLSSDVILVATNHPLNLDVHALGLSFQDETLRKELKRGGVESAEDIISYLLLTPEEIPAFTAGSPLNTDDDAIIEFGAPRDLLGSARGVPDPYLARVYAAEWPYGRFDRYLVGLGEGPEQRDRWKTELRLAKSLLAHGKRAAADRFLSAAKRHGAPADTRAARLASLLGEKETDDREIPLAAADDDPSGLGALDPPTLPDKVLPDYLKVERAMRGRAWAHALMYMKTWPEAYIEKGGRDLQLVVGYLMYKADLDDVACDRLKPLTDDKAYAARRPSVYYYLARAEYGNGMFEAAVRNMDRYLDATSPTPVPTPVP
ncbi:MAG TPA: fused MFS/spermidine synthase [Polyangia bacterium]|nr:fused MFS/spermidine synthase [Polyangia bacterium]